jgi:hypothetical protein
MVELNDIQQSFVRRYMTDERIVGVRVRREGTNWVLDVEIADGAADGIDLPVSHRGVTVRVRESSPALLAYATI